MSCTLDSFNNLRDAWRQLARRKREEKGLVILCFTLTSSVEIERLEMGSVPSSVASKHGHLSRSRESSTARCQKLWIPPARFHKVLQSRYMLTANCRNLLLLMELVIMAYCVRFRHPRFDNIERSEVVVFSFVFRSLGGVEDAPRVG